MILLLAAVVFLVTIFATVMAALADQLADVGNALNDGPWHAKYGLPPGVIFVLGMTIAGMLVLSHWIKWT